MARYGSTIAVLTSAADPIAYTDGVRDWFPTAWLAEVTYAVIVGAFGYQGLIALRFILALTFYALLGRFLHRHYPTWVATTTLCIVGVPAALVIQDRPQTFSLVLCAASLPAVRRWLFDGHLPPAHVAVPLTWFWANLHGLWILVPALYLLAGGIRLLERSVDWRPFAVGAGCLVAGAVTPVGPKLLLAPLLISSSTGEITEWQHTALYSPVAWGLTGCLLILLATWSRPAVRVHLRALVFAVVVTAFGLMAFRNAVIASVLLTPLVAGALTSALPRVRTSASLPRSILYRRNTGGCRRTRHALCGAADHTGTAPRPDRQSSRGTAHRPQGPEPVQPEWVPPRVRR